MFENLSDRLERSFKILKGEGKITEINVAETMKDVRRALLDADVNYKVAKEFTNKVKEKALGMNVLTAVKPGQLMVKLVHAELAELRGGEEAPLTLENRPAIILMSGLQGSGKTTFSGKLANLSLKFSNISYYFFLFRRQRYYFFLRKPTSYPFFSTFRALSACSSCP